VIHVDHDPAPAPHQVPGGFPQNLIGRDIRSVTFTPRTPSDVLLAVTVEGTYTAQGGLALDLSVRGGGPRSVWVGANETFPDGTGSPFLFTLPVVLRSSDIDASHAPGTYRIKLHARYGGDAGQVATVHGVRFSLLVLEGVRREDPSTRLVTSTSDTDDDHDGTNEENGDCDDANPAVRPGLPDVPGNGIDDDCDGVVDGSVPTWYRDADGDGYGTDEDSVTAVAQPAGYVAQAGDCDDGSPSRHPDAVEVTDNGIDDDCDGDVDEP
jgi:hypothetical protein